MEIKGIIAAMATAMYEDGSINESEIRNQVNRHIRAGVDGIFCLGTNGEFYILSTEEKKRVMRICVDEARGRVPVYAGTGCVGTQDTIDLSLAAQEAGADVVLFGHTHVPYCSCEGGRWFLNPGSCGQSAQPTYGIIELTDGALACRIAAAPGK